MNTLSTILLVIWAVSAMLSFICGIIALTVKDLRIGKKFMYAMWVFIAVMWIFFIISNIVKIGG